MSNGTEFHGRGAAPAHPGRHRPGGADTWTPPVPPHRPVRHRATPVDPPVSGSLPLPQQEAFSPSPGAGARPFRRQGGPGTLSATPTSGSLPPLPQPSRGSVSGSLPLPQPRDGQPLFPAAHGSLALGHGDHDEYGYDEYDDFEPEPAAAPPAESRADQAARRTRVSLSAPTPRGVDLDEDDVRVYSAPPLDGLGGFTIGSVPASVTPPKTWRKAAWFATGASGAVVVGLLCAGSFLVGKPPVDQAVQGSWPGYQGVPTVIDPTGEHQPPSEGGSAPGPENSARPDNDNAGDKKTTGNGGAGPADSSASTPGSTSGTSGTTPGTTTPSSAPQKPPVTPAQRETPVKPPWWYSFPPDAQTMGDNTEKFFNTVTTDPASASSVTTGELHDQGPHALAERYAGIAYFEVKKVSIDQQRGVTVNTVEVTHTDGTKTIEERTLTFGDGDKIAADGQ
ncbi:hypothetical protein H4696_005968 [Amycolatopsis lexingtonensis]|uniref:Serine/threonine protein kinase n=1 Tax=Amycolatopsis lexingtonensis TaxID=218822 RepID=A0ABR9I6N5_9PSEU|nr:hypothetical protein [Amycolatopsis lexingtonensis]MBE1498868.1 hypothetical protein [Amycolatopsis lexingtonensis]